jgi:hypothetical protein
LLKKRICYIYQEMWVKWRPIYWSHHKCYIWHEDDCLLSCCAMKSGRSLLVFQRCLLPPKPGRLLTHHPDDGGSKHLWNVSKLLPDYMTQKPRRQSSSYSLPWAPQISLCLTCLCQKWEESAHQRSVTTGSHNDIS